LRTSHSREKGGSNIGIIGFNSVFRDVTSTKAVLYEIDLGQVEMALGKSAREWALEHDVVLLLTHHPPFMLNSGPLLRLQEALTPSSGFLLHLCGSLFNNTLGSSLRFCQAPSLFGWADSNTEAPRGLSGYLVGQFDVPGTGRLLRLFPRIVSSTKGGIMMGPDERWASGPDEALELPIDAPSGRMDAKKTVGRSFAQSGLLRGSHIFSDVRILRSAPATGLLPPGVKFQEMLGLGHEKVGGLAWAPAGDALGIGLWDGHVAYWKLVECPTSFST
jgi:hypothetical protein